MIRVLYGYLVVLLVSGLVITGCNITGSGISGSAADPGGPVEPASPDEYRIAGAYEVRLQPDVAGRLTEVATELAQIPGVSVGRHIAVGRSHYLTASIDTAAGLAAVRSMPDIQFVEQQVRYRGFSEPDATFIGRQYALAVADLFEAWPLSTGSEDVVVAVADTGIRGSHSDFAHERFVDGWNSIASAVIPAGDDADDQGHGTHVAGIIGADGANSAGIAGAAWNVTLMDIKVLGGDGSGTSAGIAEGVVQAVERGADIINMSLGGPMPNVLMAEAIAYAHQSDVLVVVSMGNNNDRRRQFPASYPGVMAVGATDGNEERSTFSSMGGHMWITAPGTRIFSTLRNGSHGYMSGTSMSAPLVAGVAALVRSVNPELTAPQVMEVMRDTALDYGTAGFNEEFGYGMVQAAAAVQTALDLADPESQAVDTLGSLRVRFSHDSMEIFMGTPVLLIDQSTGKVRSVAMIGQGEFSQEWDDNQPGDTWFQHIPAGQYQLVMNSGMSNRISQSVEITPGETITQAIDIEFLDAVPIGVATTPAYEEYLEWEYADVRLRMYLGDDPEPFADESYREGPPLGSLLDAFPVYTHGFDPEGEPLYIQLSIVDDPVDEFTTPELGWSKGAITLQVDYEQGVNDTLSMWYSLEQYPRDYWDSYTSREEAYPLVLGSRLPVHLTHPDNPEGSGSEEVWFKLAF
ncbi:S8 family peptidase [Spirochaeta africana]|uniref:Subtilisin-like serine protease n=1 Tax=Spirochaeta africana (strain ATCC 700263 / DSM 8902 / Z-7692) TaxID=889378 RepID=H9UGY8_SPIAZ|nr:S8 family serine peptidase [Spirochaeta africana]AFG36781.1 subtilisin-like serine protease [Spirochaeta africana DSM 8902]